LVDNNKTLARKQSDPDFLKTFKVPRDMMRLKAILPNNNYKHARKKTEESTQLPDVDPFRANAFNILKRSPRWNLIDNSCAVLI